MQRFVLLAAMAMLFTSPGHSQSSSDPSQYTTDLVVMIRGVIGPEEKIGAGLIFAANSEALFVVTANHVVRARKDPSGKPGTPATNVMVKSRLLQGLSLPAEVTGDFDDRDGFDFAVLRVPLGRNQVSPGSLHWRRLADPLSVKESDFVRTVGNPEGKEWFTSQVPITIYEKTPAALSFKTDYLAPGYSGGIVVNRKWQILAMILKDSPPLGGAIEITEVLSRVRHWNYPVQLAAAGVDDPASGLAGDVKVFLGRQVFDVPKISANVTTVFRLAPDGSDALGHAALAMEIESATLTLRCAGGSDPLTLSATLSPDGWGFDIPPFRRKTECEMHVLYFGRFREPTLRDLVDRLMDSDSFIAFAAKWAQDLPPSSMTNPLPQSAWSQVALLTGEMASRINVLMPNEIKTSPVQQYLTESEAQTVTILQSVLKFGVSTGPRGIDETNRIQRAKAILFDFMKFHGVTGDRFRRLPVM